jgi:hypothetical protein
VIIPSLIGGSLGGFAMPRRSWLGLVVGVALAAPAAAQVPPGGPLDDAPVKDLTPPGFADIVPPPDPHAGHAVPHHLAPSAPGHGGFYTTAEYLLVRPRADLLDFALVNTTGGLATVGPVERLKYGLGNGLRAEAGYRFSGGCEFGFAYTYLNASGDRFLAAAAGQTLLPTITRPGLTDTALSALATARLNYNLYDALFGYRFTAGEHVAGRVFGGVRFADIGQRFDVRYDGMDARESAVVTCSCFDGFGPLIGAEATLGGWHGFHLYTRAIGGLLTGRSTNCFRETNNAGGTVYVDSRNDTRRVVPFAGIAIGGGWQYRTVSIRAGYEITHWSGLTQPLRFVDDVSQGKLSADPADLSLEGFFVQLGLTF